MERIEQIERIDPELLEKIALAIRGLSMDAVQFANSGHPGLPMGMADVMSVLWAEYLRFNPTNPDWFNRDRFVLSAGHGSMLLYSLLYLFGFDLHIDDLMQFRKWGSRTPGHPEHLLTPGVETTTGPLGQGLGNAVGMAIASKMLQAEFNKDPYTVLDHYIWVLASDGDLQEGVSHEVASLAGHLQLDNLIVLYDSNRITIDGPTDLSFSEDVQGRFESYGWRVLEADGHSIDEIREVLDTAVSETSSAPTLILFHTIIGHGSPRKAGTAKAHGEPLGEEEVRLAKRYLGIPEDENFYVPEEVKPLREQYQQRGQQLEERWNRILKSYLERYPRLYREFMKRIEGKLFDKGIFGHLPEFSPEVPLSTREASGQVLSFLWDKINGLVGGSADLTPSNKTKPADMPVFNAENRKGRYIHFGVREHGMGAILNGIQLYGGFIPYGGTFLVFSDYMRPAIRLAALMKLGVIYVFTHDSIGLGEDGPTHQPVEHLPSLRYIPNLMVIRPMDANETAVAWKMALLRRDGPTVLALTRQKLPVLNRTAQGIAQAGLLEHGAYVLVEDDQPQVLLMASGSEVHVALKAKALLNQQNVHVRVVSFPCTELFDQQDPAYRESVLPNDIPIKVAIEAAYPDYWYKYVGPDGIVVGMDRFGASAPGSVLFEKFRITPQQVYQKVMERLQG